MENAAVARLFVELADLLEVCGDSLAKVRTYRSFADFARSCPQPLAVMAARGQLERLPGVGKAIAAKVDAAVHTGSFPALDRARQRVPEAVRRLLDVSLLTPRVVQTLWKAAGIQSLGELVYACEENKLSQLPGIGPKKQARVLESARALLARGGGVLLATAVATARAVDALLRQAGAAEVVPIGAARRGVEIVRELVLLARGIEARAIAPALDARIELEGARARAAADGATLVVHGLPTRVRAVTEHAWVHALLVGTGDDAHVAWLESRAGGELAPLCAQSKGEDGVYRSLGLPFVPPELREGQVERVPAGLVAAHDVGGFFHVHTDWSDGTSPILGMARAAGRSGYGYVGISDHSRAASYANGLDPGRLAEQAAAVALARRESPGVAIFHGVEVDILEDGALDLPDEVLGALDFVIASVHSQLSMPEDRMTARILRAVSHPLVTILGHPTGRLLLGRRGFAFDLDAVAKAAAANDTYLEINANAQRLDLSDTLVKRAAAQGARFAIDPDAHAEHAVDETILGVMVARRAGLSREQVLNARDRDEMVSVLAERKRKALLRVKKGKAR